MRYRGNFQNPERPGLKAVEMKISSIRRLMVVHDSVQFTQSVIHKSNIYSLWSIWKFETREISESHRHQNLLPHFMLCTGSRSTCPAHHMQPYRSTIDAFCCKNYTWFPDGCNERDSWNCNKVLWINYYRTSRVFLVLYVHFSARLLTRCTQIKEKFQFDINFNRMLFLRASFPFRTLIH